MKIILKYLVSVRDRTGKREEGIDFPPGSSLRDVSAWLKANYDFDVSDLRFITTLNGRGWSQYPEGLSTELQAEDTICIFPLISGG
jgi:molybdopterin converting factor small subunit